MNQAGEIRPGGRTARTRAAVLAAVIEELTDHGWDQLSVESVAQRAGVHKTTVYRRWRDKNTLVAEALKAAAESRIQMPDTGDVAAGSAGTGPDRPGSADLAGGRRHHPRAGRP